MPLVKCIDGIIEEENFYLTYATDFLRGNNEYYIKDNIFTIISGTIERNLLYKEFIIELKSKYKPNNSDSIFFYVKDINKQRIGILKNLDNEELNTEYTFLKIISYKGFLQVYSSTDSISWCNLGGCKLKNSIAVQGFELKGNTPFLLEAYKIYTNPYLNIYNYPRGYKTNLLNENDDILYTGVFNNLKQCSIFLEHCFKGKIQIFNTENNLVHQTELININYGDEYNLFPYDIELYYENSKVQSSETLLNNSSDKIIIKNVSNEAYSNLKISITNEINNTDKIQVSIDNINFSDSITIDTLEANQSKEIYICIENSSNVDKIYKKFNINIS